MNTPLRTLVTGAAIGLSLAGTSVALAQNDSSSGAGNRQQIALKIHQCLATYHNAVVDVGSTTVEARLALRACLRAAVGLPNNSSSSRSSTSSSVSSSSVSSSNSSVSSSSVSSSLSSSSSSKSHHGWFWWWNKHNDKDPHDNRDGKKHDKQKDDDRDHDKGRGNDFKLDLGVNANTGLRLGR